MHNKLLIPALTALLLVQSSLAVDLFSYEWVGEDGNWSLWSACTNGWCSGSNLVFDGGTGAANYLAYQFDVDSSSCAAGSIDVNFNGVSDGGALEADDCVFAEFTSNSGGNWSALSQIFCDDGPASTITIDVPSGYESSNFRFRLIGQNFDGGGENAVFNDMNVTCTAGGGGGTCDCPVAGNWVIGDGSQCVLTSNCDIGSNKVLINNGGLRIEGATLRAGGLAVSLTAGFCSINGNNGGVAVG